MNLVRLGMIVALGGIAWYALSVYASLPTETVTVAPRAVTAEVTYMCPSIDNRYSGVGAILVAITAIGGALAVAAVDLSRRVY